MVSNQDKSKEKEGIFRQESVERLSSPERLDQLMQVVNSKDWLILMVFGGLTTIGLIWSIFGRIPINVDGRGVLIQPRQVVDFQSSIPGQLKSLYVKSGQCVKKDEVLAMIDPVDLKQQLQLTKGKLEQLQIQAQDSLSLSNQRMQLEKNAIAASRTTLEKRLQDSRSLTPVLKTKGLDAIREQQTNLVERLKDTQSLTPILKDKALTALKQQRISIKQRLKDAQSLIPIFQERFQKRRELAKIGAIATDSFLQAEQEYQQGLQTVAQLEAELKQLDVNETQTEQSYLQNLRTTGEIQAQLRQLVLENTKTEREYLDNLGSISDIQGKLQELETQEKRLAQESLESRNQRNKEIQEVSREIVRLEQQITQNSQILSSQDGCVLELTATLGQVVQPGTRLGTLRTGSDNEAPSMTAYFPIKDGKQIRSGMSISITPDTVQRERFGGILGKIVNVSPFPVTKEGATSLIGNPEVVMSLIGQNGAAIQVNADLIRDSSTISGYKWSSSKGPESEITTGTTTSVRVTIEQRAPITFVLPILQELVGMK
ncbi:MULTISPECIES: NHLP bacteriocin system secretion protein [unclassified Nostoc]|uniref:NHLP bacteriocin system secretion protein n=1 Tax=unclassified Nostoc TaxID=2593658 RepID=UPI002AD4DF10|nr:NHLP bacteriocin system secretion protein [Nostoc sp. DedQUE03]MDZ7974993.1 NHLP bacteriocin system secretion protein [Nostoc sp. DedQUE03]MDZ8046628.1 NHLP bacteriocin system secretion protein [Nostoc sp. DedQUE02]